MWKDCKKKNKDYGDEFVSAPLSSLLMIVNRQVDWKKWGMVSLDEHIQNKIFWHFVKALISANQTMKNVLKTPHLTLEQFF